jgi:hypothetical protein
MKNPRHMYLRFICLVYNKVAYATRFNNFRVNGHSPLNKKEKG